MINIKKDEKMTEIFETVNQLIEAIERYEIAIPLPAPEDVAERIPKLLAQPLARFAWNITKGKFKDDIATDPDFIGFYPPELFSCVYQNEAFKIVSKRYGTEVTIKIADKEDIARILDIIRSATLQRHLDLQMKFFGNDKVIIRSQFSDHIPFQDGILILERCEYSINGKRIELPEESTFEDICKIIERTLAEMIKPEFRKPRKNKRKKKPGKKKYK